MKNIGENVVRIEAEALRALADRIAGPMAEAFNRAVELLCACRGRVVVTGMGKSGIIARKIAATLNSTGTPALFMHPVEAVHGDLGMVVRGDVVLALSASGESEEILRLLATIKRLQVALISFTGDAVADSNSKQRSGKLSTLAAAADVALDCSVAQEACSLGLAPTASTTTMLALGDALAMSLAEKRGFKEEDFANLHPGGKLGKQLARVEALMHSGDAVPRVAPKTKMPDVIYEMSRKKLGVTTVVDGEKLVGVISDGDLRRLLEKRGKDVLDLTASECMTKTPRTISGKEFAATALALMEEKKITSLVVVDSKGKLEGIVHLHDLWGNGDDVGLEHRRHDEETFMYHYDPNTALEELTEEATLPNPVHVRDMILRKRLNADKSLELNRLFVEYQKFFGETQKLGKEILRQLASR